MNSSMIGLIDELFDTMDHSSALAALQQQVDKGDLDAMLFLGLYYMYIDLTWQPDRAFYYWDLAHERHGVDHAKLMRAIYNESKVLVYAEADAYDWVITMLSGQASMGVLLAARHLVWFAKVYRVGFSAKEVLQGLKRCIQRSTGKELLEARLLYVELLSLPYCKDTYDREAAKHYWRRMITNYTSAEVARRALSMHFRNRDGLLSESEIADLITCVEAAGQDIAYYKGYWQLRNGDLVGAYRSFEKGYARGEYRCDIALAYCLWHGYGTGVNRTRALALCEELERTDDEAMLMKARFQLTGCVSRFDSSLSVILHEAHGLHKRTAITELILQQHRLWANRYGSFSELNEAVNLGLIHGVALAASYPYFMSGEYPDELLEGRMGSSWLFYAEKQGSHPLTDCLLARYYMGIEDKPMAASYYLRVLYNPNVSLRLRKACAEELVVEFPLLDGGMYVDRVLAWWGNLDKAVTEPEHQALRYFRNILRSEVESPECFNSFCHLGDLSRKPGEAAGFINFLMGLVYLYKQDIYNREELGKYWLRSAELGYAKALERLLYQGDSFAWGADRAFDRAALDEKLDHADSVDSVDWLIGEIAGYAFLDI